MYLEIVTVAYDADEALGQFSSQGRFFVGPFKSQEHRELFREHWERRLNSPDHNSNQVKFISCDELPQGWRATPPSQFGGFQRGIWDEEAGEYREV